LAGLFDPSQGDSARVGIRTYYRLAAAGPGTTVIASIAGAPAIVERTVGDGAVGGGKVLLFNTSADDAWSDLPRRKSFVPLVDRMLEYLAGGVARRSFTAGEPIALAMDTSQAGGPFTLEGPAGALPPPTTAKRAGRTLVQIPPQTTAGVYRLRSAGAPEPAETLFVVQPAGDGSVTRIENETLRTWWGDTPLEIVRGDTATSATPAAADRSLVPWLVAAAVLVLLVETLVSYRLCPRMNPEQAQSIVRRRTTAAAAGASAKPNSAEPPQPPASAQSSPVVA
jgi:hypothetical protein